jgi:hypothetical protein
MPLRLEAIKFNHDSSSASGDAINIRRNETEFVIVPEWRRGLTINAEDSPAAYALEETRGRRLTIQASFSCADCDVQSLEIRAVDARLNPAKTSDSPLSKLMACLLSATLRDSVGNVLGEVCAKRVSLHDGTTGFETFELKDVRIWDAGVGRQDIEWRWQYRLDPSGNWTDFANSAHRIYTVLRVPTSPWQQSPYDDAETQLPWVDVLDRACDWATGAQNPDVAAALVTLRVNELGAGVLSYGSSAHYTDDRHVDCQAFLDLLRGNQGNGGYVNCDDCAAVVSTFANAIGCQLSLMSIEPVNASFIGLNPIIKIGIPDWQPTDFDYHVVASEGGCGEDDEVFDACLQVDGDDDPAPHTAPDNHIALLPTNLRFGHVGEHGYRFRLVSPDFQDKCAPHLNDCSTRRPAPARRLAAHCEDRLKALKERHDFAEWARTDAAGVKLFVLDFFFPHYVLPDSRLVRLLELGKGEGKQQPPVIQSFWEAAEYRESDALRVDVFECASWQEAREGVMALLTRFQEPGMIRRETPELGDVTFADDAFGTILFATGNLVFFLRNVGADVVPLTDVAESINKTVLNPPPGKIVAPDYQPAEAGQFHLENKEALVGGYVLIKRETEDALARRRFYQFFTDKGEVSWQDGKLVYQPQAPGPNTLEIFAVDADGNARRQVLPLNALQTLSH